MKSSSGASGGKGATGTRELQMAAVKGSLRFPPQICMISLAMKKYINRPLESTTVVIRGALVMAGLKPSRCEMRGNTPPSRLAHKLTICT